MIPRLGDGNIKYVAKYRLRNCLENDSPSRGRKLFQDPESNYWRLKLGLENDSPSRGRKLLVHETDFWIISCLENDSPSRGRKLDILKE